MSAAPLPAFHLRVDNVICNSVQRFSTDHFVITCQENIFAMANRNYGGEFRIITDITITVTRNVHSSLSQTHSIGNNGNISIRGFTT